ncbi:MAG: hypothetical protein ABH868_05390 [bacterium]
MSEHIDFYRNQHVRQRIAEYCGGTGTDTSTFTTAPHMVAYGDAGGESSLMYERFCSDSLDKDSFSWILDNGLDIFRSLWDRDYILGILDVEYYNIDYPGEIYLNQEKTFSKIEAVYEAILDTFYAFNIQPLVIMTGQGYHFSFQIKRESRASRELEKIGNINSSLYTKYVSAKEWFGREISAANAQAYDGMGRVMEYVVHMVIKKACSKSRVPVLCTDLAVGIGETGREGISLDLSMYGDPIYIRDIRCPFSTHQKHKVEVSKFGNMVAEEIPIQVSLPRINGSLGDFLEMRRDYSRASAYAETVSTRIPDVSLSFGRLIKSYKHSRLYQFHKSFDAIGHDTVRYVLQTHEKIDMSMLPPCVTHSLLQPNDNLLKPTNMQVLTRVLLKLGWHPRRIAALISSKYEQEQYEWGTIWTLYDARTRADFYVRLFGGFISAGIDREKDLNCVSHQEKGYCWEPWCGHNLENYKL